MKKGFVFFFRWRLSITLIQLKSWKQLLGAGPVSDNAKHITRYYLMPNINIYSSCQ